MAILVERIITSRTWSRQGVLLLVGLVENSGRIGWGECVGRADIAQLERLLHEVVKPTLVNRPHMSFQTISQQLDALTYTRTHTQVIEPEAGVSRRGMLSLTGLVEPERPATKTMNETLPLPAPLRYGLNQALLALFGLDKVFTRRPRKQVALHGEFRSSHLHGVDRLVQERVPSIGMTAVIPADLDDELSGQLQNLVRQVANRLQEIAPDDYTPILQLNTKGIYGELFDNSGRILGSLMGLERVGQPYKMRVIDPAFDYERLYELMDAIRFRDSNIKVGATVRTVAQAAKHNDESAHFLVIPVAEIGSLATVAQMAEACRLPFMLWCDVAETAETTRLLLDIALRTDCQALLTISRDSRWVAHNLQQR